MHCIGRFRILNLKLELNQYIALIACGVNGVFEIFSIGFCASKDFHATLNFFLKKWIIYVSPQKSEPPSWKFYYSWDPVSVSWNPPTFYNNSQFPSNTVEFWLNNFIKSFYNFFLSKEKIFRSGGIWNKEKLFLNHILVKIDWLHGFREECLKLGKNVDKSLFWTLSWLTMSNHLTVFSTRLRYLRLSRTEKMPLISSR